MVYTGKIICNYYFYTVLRNFLYNFYYYTDMLLITYHIYGISFFFNLFVMSTSSYYNLYYLESGGLKENVIRHKFNFQHLISTLYNRVGFYQMESYFSCFVHRKHFLYTKKLDYKPLLCEKAYPYLLKIPGKCQVTVNGRTNTSKHSSTTVYNPLLGYLQPRLLR